MAKNKNRNNKPKPPSQQTVKQETRASSVVTVEDAKASVSEDEFLAKKEKLIADLTEEITTYEEMKVTAERAASIAEITKKEITSELAALKEEKTTIRTELNEIKQECDEAEKKASTATARAEVIISTAEAEAASIIKSAETERLNTISKASNDAQKIWKKQADDLLARIKEISERESTLNTEKIKLEKSKIDIEFQKEELQELQEITKAQKERYMATNPRRTTELELDLKEERERYHVLLEKYNILSEKLQNAQILLDAIRTEVGEHGDTKKAVTVGMLVTEIQELRGKYDSIARLYSKYPDNTSIAQLEEKAKRTERLEGEKDALERERNRYREEVVAARNASKELEVIKQEVEATNALNEHLLQELESHKTALESRTGDTCPSLTKVDSESEEKDYVDGISQRFQFKQIATLSELVQHVKHYAGSRKKEEQLFYSDNDIRAFLSGMAVSRLLILQGMSGTGKSSLPRIFSEAISGFNRLIPVESSWRDRNELLGYYNDFNKKFNAKSFTIELYRSSKARSREVPTFIVLDEMNLARIEYYFSDFLAILQEPYHDKWLIELVSSDMRTLPMELPEDVKKKMKQEEPSIFAVWEKIERSRQGELKSETSDEEKENLIAYLARLGKLTGAKDLIDGRKIKVTDNIWFIGTANRDESTFEISDKVYDRAQVVSLNKKGKSEGKYRNTEKRFISLTDLISLFETAINTLSQEKKTEVFTRLDRLDEMLIEKFDLSFGNRIVRQTIDFVAVFVEAGGSLTDALDYQISTKILRKVIVSDDAEALLELQETTKDYSETQRLIEKRIKDLR